jgi:hypothetical protein
MMPTTCYTHAFESSADYDPGPNLHVINKPMLTINFADDLTNPPEFLNLPTASNYTAVIVPTGPDSYGHRQLRTLPFGLRRFSLCAAPPARALTSGPS